MDFYLRRVGNIEGKGEHAGNQNAFKGHLPRGR